MWHNLRNIRDFFRYDVPQGIKSLIRWFPIIWKDRDWDWVFLAKIMEFKLRGMSKNFKECGHHTRSEKDAYQTLLCAALLKRLINDTYFEDLGGDEPNWYQLPEYKRKWIIKHSQNMQKEDLRFLGEILGKYMLHWWD